MKQFDTRIQYKYDEYQKWVDNGNKIHSLAGEMYVYKMLDSTRIKFGDGSSFVSDLPYANLGGSYNSVLINGSSPEYKDYDIHGTTEVGQQELKFYLNIYEGIKEVKVVISDGGYSSSIEDSGDTYENSQTVYKYNLNPDTDYYIVAYIKLSDTNTYFVEKAKIRTGIYTTGGQEFRPVLIHIENPNQIITEKNIYKLYDARSWGCSLEGMTVGTSTTYLTGSEEPIDNIQTEKNKYTTVFTLPENFVWKFDKTSDPKTVDWEIREPNYHGTGVQVYQVNKDDSKTELSYDEIDLLSQKTYYLTTGDKFEFKTHIPNLKLNNFSVRTNLSIQVTTSIESNDDGTILTIKTDKLLIAGTITVALHPVGSTEYGGGYSGWEYELKRVDPIEKYSWKNIKELADAGNCKNNGIEVGQVKSVKLVGSIYDSFNNLIEFDGSEDLTVRLVHIEELTDSQGKRYDKLYFQAFSSEDGRKDVCIDGHFQGYFDPSVVETDDMILRQLEALVDPDAAENFGLLQAMSEIPLEYIVAYYDTELKAEGKSITSKFHIPSISDICNTFEYSNSVQSQRIRYPHHEEGIGACWWVTRDFIYDSELHELGSHAFDVEGIETTTIEGKNLGMSHFGLSPIFVIGEPSKS